MLDFNISLEFNPDINVISKGKVDALVITSCDIHMFTNDDRMYSDFDDQIFNELNGPTANLGFIDIEVGFAGYSGRPYPKVYTKCFSMYSDKYKLIKPMKMNDRTSESKINQRGETVMGIRYYFNSMEEIYSLRQCSKIFFECFFALDKPTNAYALMCQLEKDNGEWKAKYANTYRPSYAHNIKGLID